MSELMAVNKQWSSRSNDERFLDLYSMLDVLDTSKRNSQSKVVSLKDLTARPCEDQGLEIVGPSGKPASINNWAFNQLCMKAEIPAGYISSLPATLASQNINHGLQNVSNHDVGMLVSRYPDQDDALSIRAVTGDGYTRIHNADVIRELTKYVGNGVSDTAWKVPGEFGKPITVTKANTTLYGGERDIFVCLVDEENRVELPNRRDGKPGTLARGFIIWNSEVGSQTFGITTFLFDFVCANRIIWGAENVLTFKRRHTKNVLDVWEDGFKQIAKYADSKASEEQTKLLEAVNYRIVDLDKTITNESEADRDLRRSKEASAFLTSKLALPVVSKKLVESIKSSFIVAEKRPIDSLFDCVTAVTEHAKNIKFQDERIKLETAGGKLMRLIN